MFYIIAYASVIVLGMKIIMWTINWLTKRKF